MAVLQNVRVFIFFEIAIFGLVQCKKGSGFGKLIDVADAAGAFSNGEIVGIVIGSIVGAIVLVALVCFCAIMCCELKKEYCAKTQVGPAGSAVNNPQEQPPGAYPLQTTNQPPPLYSEATNHPQSAYPGTANIQYTIVAVQGLPTQPVYK